MVATTRPVRAVLFDMIGTLVSPRALLAGARAAVELMADRLAMAPVSDDAVDAWARAVQASLAEQLSALGATRFYRFADLERVAFDRAAQALGWAADPSWFDEAWATF